MYQDSKHIKTDSFRISLYICLFVCNRGDTIQHHGGLRSMELGQALSLNTYLNMYKKTFIGTYLLDVLWGQPIKLAQVASTSELRENQ